MHSNSILLLTCGLLLAAASIFAAPPESEPATGSNEKSGPGSASYKFIHNRSRLSDRKKMPHTVHVSIPNFLPKNIHDEAVPHVRTYMESIAGIEEHPLQHSDRIRVFGVKGYGNNKEEAEDKGGPSLTARFRTNKGQILNGFGSFYFPEPGKSYASVHYSDGPTYSQPKYTPQVDSYLPPTAEEIKAFSTERQKHERSPSLSPSDPLLTGSGSKEEEIREKFSSKSAAKRPRGRFDSEEPDPKRQRTETEVTVSSGRRSRSRSPPSRQYSFRNPSGRSEPPRGRSGPPRGRSGPPSGRGGPPPGRQLSPARRMNDSPNPPRYGDSRNRLGPVRNSSPSRPRYYGSRDNNTQASSYRSGRY